MGSDKARPGSLARGGVVLAASSLLANALGYALTVALARSFGPAEYGALGALLGVGLIGIIPAGGLHYAVARRVAARHLPAGHNDRSDLGFALGVGAALAALSAVLAPLAASFLHLDTPWPAVWLGVMLLPYTVQGALRGSLLGHERYLAYGVGDVVTAAARVLAGVAAGVLGLSVAGAMAALAVANLAACLFLAWLSGLGSWRRVVPADLRGLLAGLVRSCSAIAGVMVLSNVDLLLARHFLPAADSGVYALASLFAKACLWGGQFVPTLVFPRLSRGGGTARLGRRAALLTAAIGGCCVLLAAVAAEPVVAVVAGSTTDYGEVVHLAAPFAVLGTMWALVQLALISAVANGDSRPSRLLWILVAAEVVTLELLAPDRPAEVLWVALITAGVLAAGCALLDLRPHRRRPDPDPGPDAEAGAAPEPGPAPTAAQWPASSQVRPTPTDTSSGTDSW